MVAKPLATTDSFLINFIVQRKKGVEKLVYYRNGLEEQEPKLFIWGSLLTEDSIVRVYSGVGFTLLNLICDWKAALTEVWLETSVFPNCKLFL